MKLIITGSDTNAWLVHGAPHLNVRTDYMDTEIGIKRKDTYDAVNI